MVNEYQAIVDSSRPELNTPEDMLDRQAILNDLSGVVERYGEWTDHNIHLGDGIYTIGADIVSEKLRRIVQVVTDLAPKPLQELRVLDLACLEGQYAIEFARQGSRAVAIDGRDANLEKARFVKRVLGLNNLDLHLDDVRNLGREKYGEFDVVLCLGILYHLNAPDVFRFVESIGSVCTKVAVFDTYISVAPKQSYDYQQRRYWGRDIFEHDPSASQEQRLSDRWASLDNPTSVWMTRNSLLNLLMHSGFTSVYDCHVPPEPSKRADRITVVGIKGKRQPVMNMPKLNDNPVMPDFPENPRYEVAPQQRPFADLSRTASTMMPRPMKTAIKGAMRLFRGSGAQPWEWDVPWQKRRKSK